MNEEDIKRNSHWMGWTTAIVLIPVVYMLSIAPIAYAIIIDKKTGNLRTPPNWLEWYMAPAD